MLELKNIYKRFGSKQVLNGINLKISGNRIYGFVGRNGAGKTTTMKIILGMLKPDEGQVYVNGEQVIYGGTSTNRFIGYLPDVPEYYGYMTAREYLKFSGEICSMDAKECEERSEELLELVGLSDEKHRIKGYSRGMKQRLGIAQALLHRPKLLICDEPTSALDPVGRKDVLDVLRQAALKEGTTVIFSTHILSDVENICDEVALLNEGEICYFGGIKELKKKYAKQGFSIELEDETLEFPEGTEAEMRLKIAELLDEGISFKKVELMEPSLETVFMEVIGK